MIVKDELEVAKSKAIKSLLAKDEKILFSSALTKINKRKTYQDRNFLLTSHALYNLRKEGVLTSGLSFFSSNYLVKRKARSEAHRSHHLCQAGK
jgi:tRNA(His) 5'-end guanylyltransferase